MKLTKRTILITGGHERQKLDEVRRAIRGIDAGQTEIRPGLSNVLNIESRLEPTDRCGWPSATHPAHCALSSLTPPN